MDFVFSKHALEQMSLRNIQKSEVLSVLNCPGQILNNAGYKVYQSVVNYKGEGSYLLRIFVNINTNPYKIITVYKTSKIEKYYET